MLLRIVARIIQLQVLALCIYILCDWLASPNNAVVWFVTVSLILFGLIVCGMATGHRKRRMSHPLVIFGLNAGIKLTPPVRNPQISMHAQLISLLSILKVMNRWEK
jgi:hypothetical protein